METGLTKTQIDKWFQNQNKRIREDEDLFQQNSVEFGIIKSPESKKQTENSKSIVNVEKSKCVRASRSFHVSNYISEYDNNNCKNVSLKEVDYLRAKYGVKCGFTVSFKFLQKFSSKITKILFSFRMLQMTAIAGFVTKREKSFAAKLVPGCST